MLKNESEAQLVSDGIILISGTLISGGMAYAYQLASARLLSPSQFSIFASLFAGSYLIMIGSEFFKKQTIIRYTSKDNNISGILTTSVFTSLAICISIFLFRDSISSFLNIDRSILVLFALIIPTVDIINSVFFGTIRAKKSFISISLLDISGELSRIIVGIGLIYLGFGVFGAIGGGIAAVIVSFGIGIYLVRKDIRLVFNVYLPSRKAIKTIFVAFCFVIPTNADLALARGILSTSAAEAFALIALFAKILVFLSGGFTAAMFPRLNDDSKRDTKTIVLITLGSTLITGIIYIVIAAQLEEFLLNNLFGSAYDKLPYLIYYLAATLVYCLSKVMLDYHLSNNQVKNVLIIGFPIMIQPIIYYTFVETIYGITLTFGTLSAVSFVGSLLIVKTSAGS